MYCAGHYGGVSGRRILAPGVGQKPAPHGKITPETIAELEYPADAEVARLAEAAKGNRWGHRDATMIALAYRHGLRAAELIVGVNWRLGQHTAPGEAWGDAPSPFIG
jgi:hypothetical protein